jgi:hypothetical protein
MLASMSSVDDVDGYATPEEAALAGFPARYARVADVRYSSDGQRAEVDLVTNEEPTVHPYFAHCSRDEHGRWHEDQSFN